MTMYYLWLSQLLTLWLHSRIMQNGQPMLRIFLKVCTSLLLCKNLRRLSTLAEFIRKFAEACVLPLILYCSPVIFSWLFKHDLTLLKRSVKLISYVCGLSFSYHTNLISERHIKVFSDIAARILGDHQHPLYLDLSKGRPYVTTRSRFKLQPSKTAACRKSVFPANSTWQKRRGKLLHAKADLMYIHLPLP